MLDQPLSPQLVIYLGADHGGFALKEQIKSWLEEWQVAYQDLGAFQLDAADDYPDFALAVAKQVASNAGNALGVLACRSGGGMAITANKVKGVRAIPVYEPKQAIHAKSHDHANIITLAGDWMSQEQAKDTLKAFLETQPDQDQRHQRRVAKITDYEESL